MTFKGQPNLYVRINNKIVFRITGIKGFSFDENGDFKTDNEVLIRYLKQHFHHEEQEEVKKESAKVYQCKHCEFATDNKGKLAAHYKEHKNE